MKNYTQSLHKVCINYFYYFTCILYTNNKSKYVDRNLNVVITFYKF